MRDFKHALQSIYLCIKYPFLYPRNRWTGKHWSSWKIGKYLYGDRSPFQKPTTRGVWDNAFENTFDDEGHLHTQTISYLWATWFYVVQFVHEWILPVFHCIPIYTELDGMPSGWRKTFGLQMCDELKEQLKKEKYLYKYRITDIKEKYGELRLYDQGHSEEIGQIINKYTELSQRTCIDCGKPATRISQSWICPYCDDCGPAYEKYVKIRKKSPKIDWECTCICCPEQYDILVNGELFAYFRLRHGLLVVCPYVNGEIDFNTVWYECDFQDQWKGNFTDETERRTFMKAINKLIRKKLK